MKRVFWFVVHFFSGCDIPIWVRTALASKYEGVYWKCPSCGRTVARAAKVVHSDTLTATGYECRCV